MSSLFNGFKKASKASKQASAWKFRVVKRARGNDGRWFDFPTAATFSDEQKAREYADNFAHEQRGVGGAEIDVRARSGSCGYGRGRLIATFKVAKR